MYLAVIVMKVDKVVFRPHSKKYLAMLTQLKADDRAFNLVMFVYFSSLFGMLFDDFVSFRPR